MAFGISAHNAERVRSYEDCEALFKKPGFIGLGWNTNTRGLDGRRKHHMRVERKDDGAYYDVILYHTAMARYYKPEGNIRRVHYNTDGRQSSQTFQWYVLGVRHFSFVVPTTDGREVLVGMNPNAGGSFPVRLHYVNGKLDVSQSRDAPAKLPSTSSAERKAERREFKKWLRPYLAMTKLMESNPRGALYFNARTIQQAFIAKELFDPTPLCDYIMAKGINRVVDNVFPLGDVKNYNPSFKELP